LGSNGCFAWEKDGFFGFGEEQKWGLFLFLLLGFMNWWIKRWGDFGCLNLGFVVLNLHLCKLWGAPQLSVSVFFLPENEGIKKEKKNGNWGKKN